MSSEIERFDMRRPPLRQKWYLRPVTWALCFPEVWLRRTRIIKTGTRGLKPPYILLCNHNAFLDFKVATAAIFPHRSNFIVAIDGFIGREGLLRKVGCICKRKFTNDAVLIRHLQQVIKNGDILVIYPEARYSLCGTTAVIPDSIGKMCKMFKVPIVTLIAHGHHINAPFWNNKSRKVKRTEAVLTQIFTTEELASADVGQINDRIRKVFTYNEYTWQKEKRIRVTRQNRAEGLHNVLYQCPCCLTEYRMSSRGTQLRCDACGKTWTLGIYGELTADDSHTEFAHIPDWYEWERLQVRAEVEAGTYSFSGPVTVDSLPNAERFIRLGEGLMVHDMDGFHVSGKTTDGKHYKMVKPVPSLYSCHIEYDYLGKYGDCVALNTITDTWYIYPSGRDFSVTKMALATEELYFAHKRFGESKKAADAAV